MIAQLLNPFIESVYSLCSTMLNCDVERGQPALAGFTPIHGDITALIGLSGPTRGTVALSFPHLTAHAMVGRLLQVDAEEAMDSVSDGVAELVNIVAGGAKAKLSEAGGDVVNLGLPTVIRGGNEILDFPRHSTWLDVPFRSDLGPFNLRVSFEQHANKGVGG